MIARRLDEAMAKHNARNQQGVEQDCIIKNGRNNYDTIIIKLISDILILFEIIKLRFLTARSPDRFCTLMFEHCYSII